MSGFVYHLAPSTGTPDAKYVRISGTAAAPVVDAQVVMVPGDVVPTCWGIFSPDGGQTIWVVGDYYPTDNTKSVRLVRSRDGGATWDQLQLYLPGNPPPGFPTYGTTEYARPHVVHGFQGRQDVLFGVFVGNWGVAYFGKYNTSTGWVDIQQSLAQNSTPMTVWADDNSGIAYGLRIVHTPRLWRSLDYGATWASDASFDTGLTDTPYHLVVHPTTGQIWTLGYSSGYPKLRYGSWGGPWSEEEIPGGALDVNPNGGRKLCVDEAGALWAQVTNGALGHQVWRRDPGTGVWSLSYQGRTGSHGGLCVIDSQNALTSIGTYLAFWDGSTWTEYDADVDLGLENINTYDIYATPAAGGGVSPGRVCRRRWPGLRTGGRF